MKSILAAALALSFCAGVFAETMKSKFEKAPTPPYVPAKTGCCGAP